MWLFLDQEGKVFLDFCKVFLWGMHTHGTPLLCLPSCCFLTLVGEDVLASWQQIEIFRRISEIQPIVWYIWTFFQSCNPMHLRSSWKWDGTVLYCLITFYLDILILTSEGILTSLHMKWEVWYICEVKNYLLLGCVWEDGATYSLHSKPPLSCFLKT